MLLSTLTAKAGGTKGAGNPEPPPHSESLGGFCVLLRVLASPRHPFIIDRFLEHGCRQPPLNLCSSIKVGVRPIRILKHSLRHFTFAVWAAETTELCSYEAPCGNDEVFLADVGANVSKKNEEVPVKPPTYAKVPTPWWRVTVHRCLV